MVATERFPTLAAYWQQRESVLPPRTLPPADRRGGDRAPAEVHLAVPGGAVRDIAAVTGGNELLVHVVLSAAVGLTAAAWSGTREVVFGTASACGCLPVHLSVIPEQTGTALLAAHREELVDACRRYRGAGAHDHCGIVVATTGRPNALCTAAIAVLGDTRSGELRTISVRASADYDLGTVRRFGTYLMATVESMMADPRRSLASVRMAAAEATGLSAAERYGPVRRWPESSFVDLFDTACAATPGATAYIEAGGSVSLAELAKQADAVADAVRRAAGDRAAVVGIQADRSAATLAAMLGIRKAGCAYLPIEMGTPVERRRAILDRARADLFIDDVTDPTPTRTGPPQSGGSASGELFCVLATSGSTGEPQLVEIDERAVLNRLHWMWQEYPLDGGDVLMVTKAVTLVGSLWECFGGLLRGVPTVLADPTDLRDPVRLWKLIMGSGVTRLHAAPTLLDILLHEAERRPEEHLALRSSSSSAEPLSVALVERWRRRFPRVPLINLYGLTECSSNVAHYDTAAVEPDQARVSIGGPIANCGLHVMDDRGEPVATGLVGNLVVSGAAVAIGYRGEPERTERVFPRSGQRRMMRTGDLARMLPDGSFEILGRTDNLLKVRGFRISPEEVEGVIRSHPGVADVAVTTVGAEDDLRLVAYVAPAAVDPHAVRERCRRQLAGYLVPDSVVTLGRLPRRSGGKLDRRGLPRESPGPAARGGDLTVAQRAVVDAIREVTGEATALDARLADLQLNSLRMVRLHSGLHQRATTSLTVIDLFGCRTVDDVAIALGGETSPVVDQVDRGARGRAARGRMAARIRKRGERGDGERR